MNEAIRGADEDRCWCTERVMERRFRTARFGLVRCTRCGCYRIDPPPLTQRDESSRFYTMYYAQRADDADAAAGRSRFWTVAARVPALRAAGALAIDVGCGDGHLCAQLRDAGWRSVIGLDVSQARIATARRSYPDLRFSDRSIDALGLAVRSVDLIVLDNVIEHLPSPLEAVVELARWLGPQGRLVLITPNMESGHFRLLGRRWTQELAPHVHIYLFTPPALARLASLAALRVEAAGWFHLPLYPRQEWARWLRAGAVKELVWRLGQEAGALYGRLIGAGPMQYVVARPGGAG